MQDYKEKVFQCLGYLGAKLEEDPRISVSACCLQLLLQSLKEQDVEIWKANNNAHIISVFAEKLKEEKESLQAEVERLRKKSYPIEKYKKDANLKKELMEIKCLLLERELTIVAMQNEVNGLKKDEIDLKNKLGLHIIEIGKLRGIVKELEAENQQLKDDLISTNQVIDAKDCHIEKLKKEVERLNNKCDDCELEFKWRSQ